MALAARSFEPSTMPQPSASTASSAGPIDNRVCERNAAGIGCNGNPRILEVWAQIGSANRLNMPSEGTFWR
jgi:hypothetical protein